MYLCLCNRLTDHQLRETIKQKCLGQCDHQGDHKASSADGCGCGGSCSGSCGCGGGSCGCGGQKTKTKNQQPLHQGACNHGGNACGKACTKECVAECLFAVEGCSPQCGKCLEAIDEWLATEQEALRSTAPAG